MFYPHHRDNPHYHPHPYPPHRPPFPPHRPMSGTTLPPRRRPSIIRSAFFDENGQFDVGKTLETVDQLMKTVHQVTPLVKQVSNLITKR